MTYTSATPTPTLVSPQANGATILSWDNIADLEAGEALSVQIAATLSTSLTPASSFTQINSLHLIRGLIGRPGCGIYQMNGQPTAQNTRETGADGDLPGFRNWDNPEHVAQLARVWNVDVDTIPHWAPPTHAMQIFRYCEQGSIKMLWISATNPAVSLQELARIRHILAQGKLFVIVQDAFLTETGELADVVLPTALWGEKTGTYTNVDRTVHLSYKDPVSKQPHFKYAAVRIAKVQSLAATVRGTLSQVADTLAGASSAVIETVSGASKEG